MRWLRAYLIGGTAVLSLLAAGELAAVTLNPGDILVADFTSRAVIRIDPVAGLQTTVSSGGSFVNPPGSAYCLLMSG